MCGCGRGVRAVLLWEGGSSREGGLAPGLQKSVLQWARSGLQRPMPAE